MKSWPEVNWLFSDPYRPTCLCMIPLCLKTVNQLRLQTKESTSLIPSSPMPLRSIHAASLVMILLHWSTLPVWSPQRMRRMRQMRRMQQQAQVFRTSVDVWQIATHNTPQSRTWSTSIAHPAMIRFASTIHTSLYNSCVRMTHPRPPRSLEAKELVTHAPFRAWEGTFLA